VLSLAVTGVLAGCRSLTAIWGHTTDLDTHVRSWFCTRTGTIEGRTVIGVDGKTMRGARAGKDPAPHLLAALDQATGTVLARARVADKSNEIPTLRELLKPLDLDGVVVSADAMHTQTDTAEWITQQGGQYVLTPLGNQKILRRTLKKLPWKDVPSTSWGDVSHRRRERRTVKAVEAPTWVDFPGAVQVVQVRRTRTTKDRRSAGKNGRGSVKRTTVEVVYLVCSLPMGQAQPEQVATWVRDAPARTASMTLARLAWSAWAVPPRRPPTSSTPASWHHRFTGPRQHPRSRATAEADSPATTRATASRRTP